MFPQQFSLRLLYTLVVMEFPETLVLSITLHGLMSVENGDVPTFIVPEGMRIIKVSAVTPGVCNVTTGEEMKIANDSIHEVFGSPELTYEEIGPKLTSLVQSLKKIESDTIPTIRSQLKKEEDPNMRNMLRYTDKGFRVVHYESGKPIINKEFGRSDGEGMQSVEDYKIIAINAVGQPDLHSIIVSERSGATMTRGSTKSEGEFLLRLSTIVTFLRGKGVKNILLFDFSCSEMSESSERDVRNIRRNLKGLNGGLKLRRRTKRGGKKRRTTRKH